MQNTKHTLLEEVRSAATQSVGPHATLPSRLQFGTRGVSSLNFGCELGAKCPNIYT